MPTHIDKEEECPKGGAHDPYDQYVKYIGIMVMCRKCFTVLGDNTPHNFGVPDGIYMP